MKFLFARGRWEILSLLSRNPRRTFTINELSQTSGIPLATTWRAVRDLEGFGLARASKWRRRSEVSLNHLSPTVRELTRLRMARPHLLAYQTFKRRLLRRLPRLDVRLFGSVAREREAPFSDIDVLVIIGNSGYQKRRVEDVCTSVSIEVGDASRLVVNFMVRADGESAERLGARKDL